MKNQYFGDVNDYRKYGLLRVLQAGGDLSLLVAWMLTPDDGGPDGRFRSYLQDYKAWKDHDPDLYDALRASLHTAPRPAVSLMEQSTLMPRTSYHSVEVPDGRAERDAWFQSLRRTAQNADLAFLDPDNGIEVPSKPVGRKGSSKYVTWKEIFDLWATGCSLLIYQHFRRENRDSFTERLVSELRICTSAPYIEAFRTPYVLFLLAAQDRHISQFQSATQVVRERWGSQIEPVHLPGNQRHGPDLTESQGQGS